MLLRGREFLASRREGVRHLVSPAAGRFSHGLRLQHRHQRPRARGQRPPQRRLLGGSERTQRPCQVRRLPVQHTHEARSLSAGSPESLGAGERQALAGLDAGLEHPPLGEHREADRGSEQRVGQHCSKNALSADRERLLGEIALRWHLRVHAKRSERGRDLRRCGEALIHQGVSQAIRASSDGARRDLSWPRPDNGD